MGRSNPSSRSATLAASSSAGNPFLSSSSTRASVNQNKQPQTSKSRNPSPKKQSSKHNHALEQEAEDEAASLARLSLLLESFELEAAARVKSLRQKKAEQLAALERKWRSAVVQLDDQLRSLQLGDFIDKHSSNRDTALRHLVQNTIKRAPMGDEELNRRKRNAPGSPRRGGQPAGSSIEDVFGTLKKAKSTAPPSARKVVPNSSRTVRSSTARSAPKVRASLTFNPNLPPTPSIRSGASSTASRRPRRGESIITVMRSVNGSPLGSREVQYDEQEFDDEEDADEWDMMSAQEASRVEEVGKKSKKKASTKKAPHKDTFDFELPRNAPSYASKIDLALAEIRQQIEIWPVGHPARIGMQQVYDSLARNAED